MCFFNESGWLNKSYTRATCDCSWFTTKEGTESTAYFERMTSITAEMVFQTKDIVTVTDLTSFSSLNTARFGYYETFILNI